MRSTLFSFDYAPLDGGIARLCGELRRGLAGRGVGISVLSAAMDGAEPAAHEQRLRGRRPWRDLRAVSALQRLPKDELVICSRWYPEAALARLAGLRRIVVLAHGAELLASTGHRRRIGWDVFRRSVLESCRLVVANSAFTAGLVERAAPDARRVALPLGVDTDFFSPGDAQAARAALGITTRFVVATVSRLHSFKGHDVVVRALAMLPPEQRSLFTYLVTGQGPHGPQLQALARETGVHMRMTGLVSEQELPSVYRASDLFCLMTRQTSNNVEGFGLALLEAQSCGIPAIGTRTGGIPDAVDDGNTGWLLAQDDVAALAEYLRKLASEPETFRRVGLKARERVVAECGWDEYARRFMSELGEQDLRLGAGNRGQGVAG